MGPPVRGRGQWWRDLWEDQGGLGECSWSPQAQRTQTGWLCQGVGVGVILGCPAASSQGLELHLSAAWLEEEIELGKRRKLLALGALRRTELLPGWSFLIPVPQMEPSRPVPLRGLWNEVSPIVVSYRLDQTSDPKPEQKVLMC